MHIIIVVIYTNIYTHIATCTHAAPTHRASYMRMNIYTCMTHAAGHYKYTCEHSYIQMPV